MEHHNSHLLPGGSEKMYYIAHQQPMLRNEDDNYQEGYFIRPDPASLIYNTTALPADDEGSNYGYGSTTTLSGLQFETYNITVMMNFSCDDYDLLSEDMWSSAYFKIIVYMLYIPIFIFALIGNGTVCYIVYSTPRMRTVTNYFIASLAIGDILMSFFCVPSSFISLFILNYWPFGLALCHFVNYSQAVSVLVSAYTLVAISIDRYIAIMWPLKPRITKRYATFIIAGVWFIALATALPIPIVSGLDIPMSPWHTKCEKYICREMWPSRTQEYYYTLSLFALQFVVPLGVLIFTYARITIRVWAKRPPGEAETNRDQRMARSKRKMVKMMLTVVIVFTCCWLPFNILQLLLNDEEFAHWDPLPYVWFAFHWLAMSHCCYNPIIYCYMNARFRSGFVQLMHRMPGLRRWCCLRSVGDRMNATSGEMTTKYHRHVGDALFRKPKICIRNGSSTSSQSNEHIHHLHQRSSKATSDIFASEPIIVRRDVTTAVAVISKNKTDSPVRRSGSSGGTEANIRSTEF
uniref:RYamide receptor, isoform B n=1 Tax=Drosophila melanogaster TaxID=7227 RepID=A0A0B4LHT6_DROME|nr:RYamide receptor, isoform B [Drosophila melanogaster]AHN57551.1 RYamide receptor, isoform B [Drosophila melanogaster]|eukprot:NP_001287552.1 RYamide receptor, isoform B [Drosophila melanogaster]